MFEKLLSNLPFNPGAAGLMSFYAKRMRSEAAIRRTGLLFIALTFLIQFIAFLSPAQPTLAGSTNDLINGGISSISQAVSACNNNVRNYGTIMTAYGISCGDIATGTTVTLHSTDYNRQLYSMGHLPYGKAGETPVDVRGETDYWRYLWSWDSYSYSTYTAIQLKSHVSGKTYFILFNCGNLVSIGLPVQPPVCKYNIFLYASDSRCFQPCKYNSSIPTDNSQCFPHCPIPGKTNLAQSDKQCFAPCPYNKKISASDTAHCFQPCKYNSSIPATDTVHCFPPCKYNSSISATSSSCKPCTESLSSQDTLACVQIHKTASNPTQHIGDANNTTAHAGDTIVYTLYAKNTGKATVKSYVFQENLSDVLDYADVVSLNGGSLDNSTKVVSWPQVDIKAGATVTKTITVQVKSPIPSTPQSTTDPGHFDMVMTNVYGNAINIKLPPNVVTTAAAVTTSLPNTGPGTGLIVMFVLLLIGGYYFARARLLAREATTALHLQGQEGVSSL